MLFNQRQFNSMDIRYFRSDQENIATGLERWSDQVVARLKDIPDVVKYLTDKMIYFKGKTQTLLRI